MRWKALRSTRVKSADERTRQRLLAIGLFLLLAIDHCFLLGFVFSAADEATGELGRELVGFRVKGLEDLPRLFVHDAAASPCLL